MARKGKIILAIDPGKTGAVAMYKAGKWSVYDCPVDTIKTRKPKLKSGWSVKDVCDPAGMSHLIKELISQARDTSQVMLFLEKVNAGKGEGATSMFSYGRGFGNWEGIIAALEIPQTWVSPAKWKRTMLPGLTKHAGKSASIIRCKQLFPYLIPELKLVKHHGRADAVLIGEYGRKL